MEVIGKTEFNDLERCPNTLVNILYVRIDDTWTRYFSLCFTVFKMPNELSQALWKNGGKKEQLVT